MWQNVLNNLRLRIIELFLSVMTTLQELDVAGTRDEYYSDAIL